MTVRIRPLAEADVDDILALAPASASRGALLAEVTSWQQQKSPTVVARTAEGVFAGFARARPNEVETSPRPEGQVAELVELSVAPDRRAQGVGTALLERAAKTLRLLGYSRVVAQFDDAVAPWFAARGFELRPEGFARAWIEPFIPRDDLWFPEARSGSFSPLLVMDVRPTRPRQGWMRLTEHQPLIEADYAIGPRADENATAAIVAALAERPDVALRLPPRLRAALLPNEGDFDGKGQLAP